MDVREKTAPAETPETLVELISVPGKTVGEGREQNPGGYDGFVVVLDRVRAGRDGEVLGHVIGELWWFEEGVGVELWSDFAEEPPVRPERSTDGGRPPGAAGSHPEESGAK